MTKFPVIYILYKSTLNVLKSYCKILFIKKIILRFMKYQFEKKELILKVVIYVEKVRQLIR